MTVELEKILFDLNEQMTREVYDLRRKYHEGTLARENVRSYLKALGKRQKEAQRKLKEIIKELCR